MLGALSHWLGRAIAPRKPNSKRGREPLRRGEAPVVEKLKLAAEKVGWDHPVVREVLQTLLGISRGAPGYRGRHVGVRLSAAREILHQLVGTPAEKGGSHGDGGGAVLGLLAQLRADRERERSDG